MMRTSLVAASLSAMMIGCAVTPLSNNTGIAIQGTDGSGVAVHSTASEAIPRVVVSSHPGMSPIPYKDTTLDHPNVYFEETPQSRSVIAGSALHANLAGCSFIQRYRLGTNADFTSTTNMFKYRAAMLGAERVVFIHHSEIDVSEATNYLYRHEIHLRSGTNLRSSRFLSVMIGDLYDCPCNVNSCK